MTVPISSYQQQYLNHLRKQKRFIVLIQIAICAFFVFLWEISTKLGWLNDFIFSSPSRILSAFIDLASDGNLFHHVAITLSETFLSFFIDFYLLISIVYRPPILPILYFYQG